MNASSFYITNKHRVQNRTISLHITTSIMTIVKLNRSICRMYNTFINVVLIEIKSERVHSMTTCTADES